MKSLDLPSTAGGLAFLPKGFRLAIAHYNGASLWFPNAQAKPEILEWKGSHLGVTVSPDGRFLVTTMQEPMLHGWRLVDGKHMRMSGYAARVRSFAWTADGAFLATGGSDQLILWPFSGKDGPMGKQPTMLAPHGKRLAVVACHPKQPVVAAATRTAWCCWCGSTTAPRCSCIRPNSIRRSRRSPGAMTGCGSPLPARTASRAW